MYAQRLRAALAHDAQRLRAALAHDAQRLRAARCNNLTALINPRSAS